MSYAQDVLVQAPRGSTDWAGGFAPAGGTHTGTCLITFVDGFQITVAHSVSEAKAKILEGNVPTNPGTWVAFDIPNEPVPTILCTSRIENVH